jgi:predicted Ser/Thr protein kinase
MEESIEQIVSFFRHAAQGLEERKQILYLLGPVGGGKSSLAEKLKSLMQKMPFYALKDSPSTNLRWVCSTRWKTPISSKKTTASRAAT